MKIVLISLLWAFAIILVVLNIISSISSKKASKDNEGFNIDLKGDNNEFID